MAIFYMVSDWLAAVLPANQKKLLENCSTEANKRHMLVILTAYVNISELSQQKANKIMWILASKITLI